MAKGERNRQLGDYVRARRTSMGFSLSEAADASGLDPSYWNKLVSAVTEFPCSARFPSRNSLLPPSGNSLTLRQRIPW
jgi:transcriptional regulator with XRE-family HTH domain